MAFVVMMNKPSRKRRDSCSRWSPMSAAVKSTCAPQEIRSRESPFAYGAASDCRGTLEDTVDLNERKNPLFSKGRLSHDHSRRIRRRQIHKDHHTRRLHRFTQSGERAGVTRRCLSKVASRSGVTAIRPQGRFFCFHQCCCDASGGLEIAGVGVEAGVTGACGVDGGGIGSSARSASRPMSLTPDHLWRE